jgi:arylsulfatase A-like enzyme
MRLRTHSLFSLVTILLSCGLTRAVEKPDIVYILSDDQGSYDVGWRGSEIKTPNLDKLARSGARLDQFYVQPLCSPTRAALMTGRYPMRYGLQVGVILPTADYGLPREERMLPEALRQVGYTTAICGKWHLGSVDKTYWPDHRGFDHWYGFLFGMTDYFTHTRSGNLDWWRDGQPNHDQGYTTELIGREAAKLIRNQSTNKPLFLYVPFNAVHYPFQVPEKYKEPYAHLQEPRRTYAGMTAAMDEAIGNIVAAIDETGRRKNTLIIFSSDNGGYKPGTVTSNGPLRGGKGTLYEGGVQTCAFATWENHIKAGSAVKAMTHMVDWYPTLLTLTGASLKQKSPLDGKNIWPCLTAGAPSPHDELLLNSTPDHGAIRVGDWKLVLHGNQAESKPDGKSKKQKRKATSETKVELYNLADDLSETNNLAEKNTKKLQELRSRYEALATQAVAPKGKADVEP